MVYVSVEWCFVYTEINVDILQNWLLFSLQENPTQFIFMKKFSMN